MGNSAVFAEIQASLASFGDGPEASAAFAAFAEECRDEVIATDQPSTVVQYVDGSKDAPLASVKVPGTVRFEFGYLREVVAEIYNMLIQASPYSDKRPAANPPTHYKDENVIFVNGVQTDDITSLRPSDEVKFGNLQPYSRKIEKGLSMQAPNGVYEAVARLARSRFGNSADIQFGYDVFPGAGPNQTEAVRSSKAKSRADDRFPTITVKAIT